MDTTLKPRAAQSHGAEDGQNASDQTVGHRFGRAFPMTAGSPMILKLSACAEIGRHMTAVDEVARNDSVVPAGYTYFGQFVDHDISFDNTRRQDEGDDPATDEIEPTPDERLKLIRTPSLDLDSLYGPSPNNDHRLFDGPRFRIGVTTGIGPGVGPVDAPLAYDLPRESRAADGKIARKAIIGDPRNDENLAVAQIHLMWLKFHNHIVDHLAAHNPGMGEGMLLETARELVVRHYQHIVLHDFLGRIVSSEVHTDVIQNENRRLLPHGPGETIFMPLEFSVAAYRYGHSQVRENYDWNVNFGTGAGVIPVSNFRLLFRFSELSGDLGGQPTLPTNWIPDLRRLFDLSGFNLPHLNGSVGGNLNFAKRIDPFLAPALGLLPEIEMMDPRTRPPFSNLAALNLRRGSMRGLPSGQDVSRELPKVKMLTEAQMRGVIDAAFSDSMEALGFYKRTPLWLYVLLEAAAVGQNDRLGPLGSTVVAETFMALVATSRLSILAPGAPWTPADAQVQLSAATPLDSIAQILSWMDERTAIIDPLQDARVP